MNVLLLQLWFAQLLTGVYVLVQMLVLVGLIVEMSQQEICYPTTVFFLFVTFTFVLSATIHPQEFSCLIHGFTYYLAIPTMYMLLMIYSICNLHVVSWGTREVKQTATEKKEEEEKKEQKRLEEEAKKQQKKGPAAGLLGKFTGDKNEHEGWTLRCGDCFSYVCCPRHRSEDEKVIELKLVLAELQKLERSMEQNLDTKIADLKLAIDELRPPTNNLQDYEYNQPYAPLGNHDNYYYTIRQIQTNGCTVY